MTISFDIFDQIDGLFYAFSTRKAAGAISSGPFSNLNLGNDKHDDSQNIEHNRSLFFKGLNIDPKAIVFPGQIHSANVRLVEHAGRYPETDALVTAQYNLFLSVQTADCFPVFLVEPEKKVIALIHAGWRGAINNIVTRTINLMTDELAIDPKKILAVIGPGLKTECFEVKSDVYKLFPGRFRFPHPDTSKKYIDLAGFIKDKLFASGLTDNHIEVSDLCSNCRDDLFFSYRRDGEKSGRMMGILGIRK